MATKTKKISLWSLIGLLIIVFFASATIFAYQNAYNGKIYKNVSIAGINVSGKTKKQAEILVQKKFDNVLKKNIIFTAGEKSINTTLSETGLSFNISDSIAKAYAIGRKQNFLSDFYVLAQTNFNSNKISVPILIDNTKLNLFISGKIPELNVSAQDASIAISDGQVKIVSDVNGQNVDTSNLAADLTELISSGADKYEIKLQAVSTAANITSTDLESVKSEAEDIIKLKFNFIYNNQTYTPSASDISAWLAIKSDNGKTSISLDDNAVKSYLSKIAKNFEISKKDRKINASDNSVMEEGIQGVYLNKDKALAEIKNAVSSRSDATITLVTYTQDPNEIKVYPAAGIVPDKYPGKYIDVDLSQQRLCRIENNNVIDCFTVSTGKASTPTPTGTRYIESKEAKRWSSPYGLWMPWWQSLGGGYGIHELPEWPSGYKEGESHLGTPVSHGCIRLGVGPAQTVFDWTEIGTPVYIHK